MGNNNWEDDDGWENEDDIYSGTEMIRKEDEDIFDMTKRLRYLEEEGKLIMKEKKELLKQRDLLLKTVQDIANDMGQSWRGRIYWKWCNDTLKEIG